MTLHPLGYWERLEDPDARVVVLSSGKQLCVSKGGSSISGDYEPWKDALPTEAEMEEARTLAANLLRAERS